MERQTYKLGRQRDAAIDVAALILERAQRELGALTFLGPKKNQPLPTVRELIELVDKRAKRGGWGEVELSNGGPATPDADFMLCTLARKSDGYEIELFWPLRKTDADE